MFSKKNKILKELGFYDDQEGILNRCYRENGGWNAHLENTKKYILKSTIKAKTQSIAILGSGWLLDVPLKELSEIFSEVHLFDIIHPKEIKQKTKRFKNVQCIEKDITGGYIESVYNFFIEKKTDSKDLFKIKISEPDIFEKYDFVVSVNILNQLDIILVDYINRFELFNESEIVEFRKKIQKNHIDFLPTGKTCLITDYEELIFDKELLIETKQLIHFPIQNGFDYEYWQWEFDKSGTYNKDKKTIFNVMALNL